ncbi:MAG: hypothetical protein KAS96_03400 [Planctomycetes bacterium]|nr:hypothetical protein [Planctomycetota bacterium]
MKKLLVLAVLLVFVGSVFADVTDGLVAHWEFEDNADDSSGNDYHGVITQTSPSSTHSFVDGPFDGQAFESLDGSYINITGSGAQGWADFQNSSMSIAMWVKSSDCTSLAALISKGSDAYKISQYSTPLYGRVKTYANGPGVSAGSTGSPYIGSTCYDGQWHHIVSVLDRSANKHKIYLDGELTGANYSRTTDSDPMVTNSNNLAISANPAAGTDYYFRGAIDDVRIYDRALTGFEVEALFNPRIAVNPVPANGAVNVGLHPKLSWEATAGVTGYDVYLGTHSTAVDNATIASGGIYQGYTDTNSIILAGGFEDKTIYYWRVDSIADAEVTKGMIWEFTTCKGGDFDDDDAVGYEDLRWLTVDWLADSGVIADGDGDGNCNMFDYAIWANNFSGLAYYFDSVGGNDSYTGESPQQAWMSLSKFNSTTFLPGDRIYFKTGSQWNGSMQPKGSGVIGSPIIIDAYGDISDENNKPRFDGNGTVDSTLYISNVEYWEVNNLQITNLGATRGAWRTGARINAADFGTMKHIHLKNLYVHSVNGLIAKEDGGGSGISWFCGGDAVPTKFDGILIEDCHIKTTDRDGIVGGNTHIGRLDNNPSSPSTTRDWYPSVNVVVRGNLLEDIGGDAIVPIGTDGCIVEYNTVTSSAVRTYNYFPTQWAAAIWPWSADNTIIQYNIVTGTKGTNDGQSFNADYNTRGTIFQYNYSYSNEGGFILVYNGGDNTQGITGNRDTIIRYNISVNDGGGTTGSPMLQINGLCTNVQIYNNVFISPAVSTPYFQEQQSVKLGTSFYWSNNIFYSNATTGWRYRLFLNSGTMTWSNNCFFGNFQKYQSYSWVTGYPPDTAYITTDPLFVSLPVPPSSADAGSADGFKLQSGSPCIDAGTTITGNGGYDFWGNVLYNGLPDIGAQEQ